MFMARPPLIERVVLESRVQILKGDELRYSVTKSSLSKEFTTNSSL